MITKIAFFGSADLTTSVLGYASSISKINVFAFPYQSPEEMAHLISKASFCDVYLFSGVLPFFITKKNVGTFDKPSVFIADNELNVALTLLSISNKKIADFSRISFDLPNRKMLDPIITGLTILPKPIYVADYPWIATDFTRESPLSDILKMHIALWEAKKIDFVVTSIHALYDELLRLNIPCMRMIDPEKNINDALLEAKNLGVLQQTEHSQVAAGFISISSMTDSTISADKHHFIVEKLESLSKVINCTVQKEDGKPYGLYGTKGGIEYLLTNIEILDDMKDYATANNLGISIGFGFGMTIIDAEKNAHIGLSYSKSKIQDSTLSIYTVNENKTVINSLDSNPKHYILLSEDEKFIQMAKKIGISVTNLNKMIQFTNSRPINRFTSSDIVDYFEITKRSAERILKKFFDCGYLEIVGEEQPFQHGRPRSVYRLNLPH